MRALLCLFGHRWQAVGQTGQRLIGVYSDYKGQWASLTIERCERCGKERIV
jgi:hypothetical protein